MLELASHILTIVFTSIVVENRRRLVDLLRNVTSSTPQVDQFEKLVKESYEFRPFKRPYCYTREDHIPQQGEQPTFHFFIRDGVEIERFMAFLLPSLDYGHGRKTVPAESGIQHKFTPDWDDYMRKIATKVKKASSFPRDPSRFSRKELDVPIGSRIIFFDKQLIALFLFGHDWIYQARDRSGSPQDQFAESIIQYAADIVVIHNRMKSYQAMECRYVAESAVAATNYYDFGLYTIEGVDIVYAPVYQQDSTRKIQTEKVFIGNTVRQRRRIEEFIADYSDLWKAADEECNAEHGKMDAISDDVLGSPDGELYQLSYLTLEFFERIYADRIYRILRDKSKFRIPPIEVPNARH